MKGIEYKIIRMSRKISAQKIAKKLGYKSKTPVLESEKLRIMPDVYIFILEYLTDIQLRNEDNLEQIIYDALSTLQAIDPRNTIWRTKYGKLYGKIKKAKS